MKIIYIDPFSSQDLLGGSQKSLLELMVEMVKRGHEVILAVPGDGLLARKAAEQGISVATFFLPKLCSTRIVLGGRQFFNLLAAIQVLFAFIVASFSLWRVFQSQKPDIVHSNQITVSIAAGIAARLSGIPCIWHIRENPSTTVPVSIIQAFGLLANWFANRVIVNSTFAAAKFQGSKGFSKIDVIPIGIPSVRATRKSDADETVVDLGIPKSAYIVSILARLIPMKGHDVLINALKYLVDRRHDVHLLVVGHYDSEDRHYKYLTALVKQMGLSRYVHFLGFHSDIQPILTISDVIVSTSKEPETFGRTLIEAMAAGKPVVATKVGAHSEIVQNGVTGFLIDPNDSVALAQKLERLMTSNQLSVRIGKAGRARFRSNFTIQGCGGRIEKIYLEITNSRPQLRHRKHQDLAFQSSRNIA